MIKLTDEEVGALTVFDGLHHVETPLLAKFIRKIEGIILSKIPTKLTNEQIMEIQAKSWIPYKQPVYTTDRLFGESEDIEYKDSEIFSPIRFARLIEAATLKLN